MSIRKEKKHTPLDVYIVLDSNNDSSIAETILCISQNLCVDFICHCMSDLFRIILLYRQKIDREVCLMETDEMFIMTVKRVKTRLSISILKSKEMFSLQN